MSTEFPMKFTLEDGVHVEVKRVENKTYDFTLTPKHGAARHFTFVDDKPRNELIENLDFDQLNAVRRFWLLDEE